MPPPTMVMLRCSDGCVGDMFLLKEGGAVLKEREWNRAAERTTDLCIKKCFLFECVALRLSLTVPGPGWIILDLPLKIRESELQELSRYVTLYIRHHPLWDIFVADCSRFMSQDGTYNPNSAITLKGVTMSGLYNAVTRQRCDVYGVARRNASE